MDRPEWTTVNPLNGDVYLTLTNNSARTPDKVDAANPRGPNRHGHIIRWHDSDDQLSFTWDIFVFGANALKHRRHQPLRPDRTEPVRQPRRHELR